MESFSYYSPTRIVFGKNTIKELARLIPTGTRILLTFGGGSIKKNSVYDQIKASLKGFEVFDFGGIEPNPRYETCMKAVALAREKKVDFLLAAGGGSVLDGTKFIAAAIPFEGQDPWDILIKQAPVKTAVPLGCILTLPATGSEMNSFAVVSRDGTTEKRAFSSDYVRPQFSILDPETTYSLPDKQTANGIVDTFTHVMEQYATYPAAAPLQERQAEAILSTVIELASKVRKTPRDYDVRASLMWCATHGLNQMIGCGVPHDWATHMIGHELTALYGIDHGESLAVVLPGVLTHQLEKKKTRLVQFAERIWGIKTGNDDERARAAINCTEKFFREVGTKTRLSEYNIPEAACKLVAQRLAARGAKLGEHEAIGEKEVAEILESRM